MQAPAFFQTSTGTLINKDHIICAQLVSRSILKAHEKQYYGVSKEDGEYFLVMKTTSDELYVSGYTTWAEAKMAYQVLSGISYKGDPL